MNKYLAIAAISTVSGCHMSKMLHKPLFGLLEQGPHCPKSDAPKYGRVEAFRLLMQNMHRGWVKGFYQENADVISDKCFGEDLESIVPTVWGLKKKMHADFWSVSVGEVKDVADQVLDTVYTNMANCQFERIHDDMQNWCLENPGKCLMMEDVEDRIVDNLLELTSVAMDIAKVMDQDDTCYSDAEQMAEIYRFVSDLGEIAADLSGFDYKWDSTVERTHIKRSAFKTAVKEAYQQFKGLDRFGLMFPDLEDLMVAIDGLLKELKKQLKETLKGFKGLFHLPKPVHHEQTHHKSLWHNPLDLLKPQQPTQQHQTKKMDPVGDILKVIMPQHHQQRADPIGDLFKGISQPQQHFQKHFPTWGQFQQPHFQTFGHQWF